VRRVKECEKGMGMRTEKGGRGDRRRNKEYDGEKVEGG